MDIIENDYNMIENIKDCEIFINNIINRIERILKSINSMIIYLNSNLKFLKLQEADEKAIDSILSLERDLFIYNDLEKSLLNTIMEKNCFKKSFFILESVKKYNKIFGIGEFYSYKSCFNQEEID